MADESNLLAAGVRQNETTTSSFSISPDYNSSQAANKITRFTATNSIQIDSNNTANLLSGLMPQYQEVLTVWIPLISNYPIKNQQK